MEMTNGVGEKEVVMKKGKAQEVPIRQVNQAGREIYAKVSFMNEVFVITHHKTKLGILMPYSDELLEKVLKLVAGKAKKEKESA